MISEKKKNYLLFILVFASFSILFLFFIEYFWIPMSAHLPRKLLLIGHIGIPGETIDDTPINSMGFTGNEIELDKPEGTTRILTLGGSAFFNRLMTQRLEKNLQKVSEKRVEILGAALRRHTSMSSLRKFEALKEYQFDVVLIYHGINDLWANHVSFEEYKEDYSHLGPWYKRNFFLDNSLLLRRVYNSWISPVDTQNIFYLYPPKTSENLSNFASERNFSNNLKSIIRIARENGTVPILMTFAWNIPESYSKEKFDSFLVGYNNPENYDRRPVELWGSKVYVREGLIRHNDIIRRLSEEMNVLVIDQEKLLGKNLRWFGDVCHLSDEGTNFFIKNISEFYIKNGLSNLKE